MTMLTKKDLIEFEAEVAEAFNAGKIRAPVHLTGGNELELREAFLQVKPDDWVCTTWRSHYHCLLKGVPRDVLMRDILAGKSITLNYPDYRVISSAIVAGVVPIAVGIAMSIKLRGGSDMVHCFVGDMTARAGVFLECQRYVEGHALPLRFYVEDNGKSVCTPTADVWGTQNLVNRTPGGSQIYDYDWKSLTRTYQYELPWPHSGAGKRVEF